MVRFFFLMFTIFVLAGCAGRTMKDKSRAMLHLQMGNGSLQKGNYPAALGEFLKAQELDPENPLVQNSLGLAYFVRGKFDLAEKHFKNAIRLDDRFTEARNNLGRTYIELKRYDQAVEVLLIAARDLVYTEPEKTYSNLGLAYFQKSDFAKAEGYFLKSLELQRKNCFTMNYYGRSLYELSEFQKAASSLDQGMKLCKEQKFEEPYFYSAMSYMKVGQREQAVARLEEGLSTFPDGALAPKARSMLEILK